MFSTLFDEYGLLSAYALISITSILWRRRKGIRWVARWKMGFGPFQRRGRSPQQTVVLWSSCRRREALQKENSQNFEQRRSGVMKECYRISNVEMVSIDKLTINLLARQFSLPLFFFSLSLVVAHLSAFKCPQLVSALILSDSPRTVISSVLRRDVEIILAILFFFHHSSSGKYSHSKLFTSLLDSAGEAD